jgi:hypothetical protein
VTQQVVDDIQAALVIAQGFTANQGQQDALARVQTALAAAQAHHTTTTTKMYDSNILYGHVAVASGTAV